MRRGVNRGLHEGGVGFLAPPIHRSVYEVHLGSVASFGLRVDIVHIAQLIFPVLAIASFSDSGAALTLLPLAELDHVIFVRVLEQTKLLLRIGELADHKVLDIAQALNHILLHLRGLELSDHLLYVLVLPLEICLLHRVILRLDSLLPLLLHGGGALLLGAEFA